LNAVQILQTNSQIKIANNCLKIESIPLSSNKNITYQSLIEFSMNSVNLKLLNIQRWGKKMFKIRRIDLDGNENITDFSLFEIANNCINLKILNLNYCTKITKSV
jgi:hypothetical protein